ncbi:MAG TPA: DNA polymerase/3'-5' exonuclease PolX [bacterium]|nr:DNA polymerase/3'-5' exonuclease PolX [bacterium]
MPASRNLDLARIFAEIADFLEIKQESTFRINAYRRAARALESLGEDIATIAERGELRAVGGIGASLAEKIEEYLKSDVVAYHAELLRELPRGLSELMTLPEIGPKTARLLYEQLGIADVDALERAARAGRIRGLPRMGAKTEANILLGIERRRRQAARHPLGAVLPYAKATVDALRRLPGVEALSLAGSIRRMRDTIADIDIVAATRAPERVMDTFVGLPQVAQVLSRGTTRSSVILGRLGVQCDVRAVEPDAYGAALQYFTGSKDHNVQLREMGVRRGLKINEYGVFRVADDVRIAGQTEEEVYRALDLPWVPPEIREGHGELELAQRGSLPALVALGDIRGDLHMHTAWSDGQDTVEAMARAAKARGYEYVCVTDHSQSLKFAGGVSVDALREHAGAVARVSERTGIRVLIGAEVDILADGSLDYPDDVLASLDLVIGSVHTRMQMPREALTQRIVRALEHPHLDVLGHPTGRLIGEREPMDLDMEAVVEAARRTGTVLEINASPERLDLRDVHVRLARDHGVLLEIGSDAHRKEHFAQMEYGVGTARRGWVEAKDVINTWPLGKLLIFLER